MTQRDEEEEEEQRKRAASPTHKAWFAGHADAEHAISAGFRGVPGVPHGGSQTVTHHDITGSMDLCWCGLQFDHDWPGKADGRKHPRKEQKVTPTPTTTEEQPRIERRALRAYHADLADIILSAVNDYHVRYRITAHSVILFPPDKTAPYAINARNGDRQVKPAMKWFGQHCVPQDISIKQAAKPAPSTKPVDEDTVKELAEMLNSEEHLPKADSTPDEPATTQPVIAPPAKKTMSKTAKKPVETPTEKPAEPPAEQAAEEWVPYLKSKSQEVHPDFLINETTGKVKCKRCGDILAGRTSTAGHLRTHHSDTSTLWGPEAKAKANNTYFTNKAKGQVVDAIAMLQNAIGVEPPKPVDTSAQDAETRELRTKNEALVKENGNLKMEVAVLENERDELRTKITDMETKAALAREALGL